MGLVAKCAVSSHVHAHCDLPASASQVGWRVQAEVKAAEERVAGELAELREALEAARTAAARQEAEVASEYTAGPLAP